MDDVAVVICTCKKYEEIFRICESYLKYFWPNCTYAKYIVTDKEINTNSNSIQIIDEQLDWGGRLRKALLSYIKENIVILILDDFIVEEKVNEDILNKYIDLMKKNLKIAHILLNTVDDRKNVSFNTTLYKQNPYAKYKTSLQLGIWRKEDLLLCIKDVYTPWEVELFGNMRTYKSKKLYLCLKNKKDKPFVYNDGFFVVQGYINQEELQRLERKFQVTFGIETLPVKSKIIRDNITLLPRIIRRIKIILAYIYYRYMRIEVKE